VVLLLAASHSSSTQRTHNTRGSHPFFPYAGVNIGQALKSEAVWYRRSKDLTDVASTNIRLEKLDAYHGVPSGMFQADEHLAGKMPSHVGVTRARAPTARLPPAPHPLHAQWRQTALPPPPPPPPSHVMHRALKPAR
jgi:hypothetical protein